MDATQAVLEAVRRVSYREPLPSALDPHARHAWFERHQGTIILLADRVLAKNPSPDVGSGHEDR